MQNDQWFNPGDKVMRVSRGNPFRPGFFIHATKPQPVLEASQ